MDNIANGLYCAVTVGMSASSAKNYQNMREPFLEVAASALQHIEKHGSLVRHSPDRAERLELMKALSKQGLVAWNKKVGKYQLTALGCKQHDQEFENSRHEVARRRTSIM